MTVLYLVGPPGVGKTTLARQFIEPGSRFIANPKWTVGPAVCAAGHYVGGAFDGADTVPYNGVAPALAYWESCLADSSLTLLDGDRFSHASTVAWFVERGHAPVCVALSAPDAALDERRAARGSRQNAAWMKGRVTKAERFAASFPAERVLRLDATRVPEGLKSLLRQWLLSFSPCA